MDIDAVLDSYNIHTTRLNISAQRKEVLLWGRRSSIAATGFWYANSSTSTVKKKCATDPNSKNLNQKMLHGIISVCIIFSVICSNLVQFSGPKDESYKKKTEDGSRLN